MTGVVAALRAEARSARALARGGGLIQTAGTGNDRSQTAARTLLEAGATQLLVWGTAGALTPELRPGTLILSREVRNGRGECWPVSRDWHQHLVAHAAEMKPDTGPLITVDQPMSEGQAKSALARQTGSVAVDMETAAVARLAADQGVPFAVVRAIVDPLERTLPQAVSQGATSNNPALGVARRLASRPRDLPGVIALGRNMRAARRSLALIARRLAEAEP